MKLKPLYDPARGPLRIVGLMSGSGTNLRRILEHQERLAEQEGRLVYEVVAVFSDAWDSKAVELGRDHDLPVVVRDLRGWLKKRGVARADLKGREEFDRATVAALKPFGAEVAAYAGYMSLATPPLIQAWLGVNVHPADLSVTRPDGRRRWTGAHAVRDAAAAGEKFIRSSTHRIEQACDLGRLFMISAALPVQIPRGTDLSDPAALEQAARQNQDRLKEKGDWIIFPRTLEAIARGQFQQDPAGNFYFQGQPIPQGLRLEDSGG
jgi:folate-dependent phosphoribosylglycinamide formyltransferase PurN